MRWAIDPENLGRHAKAPMGVSWVVVLEDIWLHSGGGECDIARDRGGAKPF